MNKKEAAHTTDLKGKCIAFTVAFGPLYPKVAECCQKSFHAWHPDVPFLIFTENEYRDWSVESLFLGRKKKQASGNVFRD